MFNPRNRKKWAAFFIWLIGLPGAVRAWGPVGHKAVGLIAQSELTPEASREVGRILGPGVGLDQIANCPDALIYATATFRCGGAFDVAPDSSPASRLWHFIDIPVQAHPTADSVMRYCPGNGNCVIAQIRRNLAVLKDPQETLQDKQWALMFVVHFVGDEHQPLHCADDDDRGGNLKPVTFLGEKANLHKIWDDELDQPRDVDYRLPDAVLSAKAKELAKQLEAQIGAQDKSSWTRGDMVADAGMESFSIAQKIIYPQYAKDRGQDLGIAYQKEMQPVAYRRIAMAGVRLAALLNQALKAVQH